MTLGDHCLADLRQAAADFNEAANAPFHTLGPLRLFKTRWTFLHTRLLPPGCPEPTRCTWTSSYKRLCLLQAPNQNVSLTSDAILYTKSLSATQSSVLVWIRECCEEEHFHFPEVSNAALPWSVHGDILPTMVEPRSMDLPF